MKDEKGMYTDLGDQPELALVDIFRAEKFSRRDMSLNSQDHRANVDLTREYDTPNAQISRFASFIKNKVLDLRMGASREGLKSLSEHQACLFAEVLSSGMDVNITTTEEVGYGYNDEDKVTSTRYAIKTDPVLAFKALDREMKDEACLNKRDEILDNIIALKSPKNIVKSDGMNLTGFKNEMKALEDQLDKDPGNDKLELARNKTTEISMSKLSHTYKNASKQYEAYGKLTHEIREQSYVLANNGYPEDSKELQDLADKMETKIDTHYQKNGTNGISNTKPLEKSLTDMAKGMKGSIASQMGKAIANVVMTIATLGVAPLVKKAATGSFFFKVKPPKNTALDDALEKIGNIAKATPPAGLAHD